MKLDLTKLSRRELFKLSLMTGSATLIGSRRGFGQSCSPGFVDQTPVPYDLNTNGGLSAIEQFPVSPFILNPFADELPIPAAMRPGYRQVDGSLLTPSTNDWQVRNQNYSVGAAKCPPGPGRGQQDCYGSRSCYSLSTKVPDAGTHQLWTDGTGSAWPTTKPPGFPLPNPILYHIRLQVRTHSFSSSPVQVQKAYFSSAGLIPVGTVVSRLPDSTIYGFNGTFPGPRINAEYGKPCLVRFENDLDFNPLCRNRQDFGAPDWAFLTHLHNGHTAPESDGQPHHMTANGGGYQPGDWCDNLYLNYAAGNDDAEKQSFLWFHDHRMHHTGPNVYKGMVGLFPIYDPILDAGDETKKGSLQLPGRRVNNPDGTFDVKYDIPMALYDCCLDDGATQHQDFHNGFGELHPEWWGQLFFRHFPNHGFVGDIFTINGTAYPVLHVTRRKYRLRFLGASISRIYELMLMRSVGGPAAAPATLGQWQLPDGQQCMRFTQIASEGGLLPSPIIRDSFQIWPAKRREVVVDFTQYQDKSPTRKGDVLYLVNVLEMPTGRKPDFLAPGVSPGASLYKVPMMKIVIGDDPPANEPDVSRVPSQLRNMPRLPQNKSSLPQRQFILSNQGLGGENQWAINSLGFVPTTPLAQPQRGKPEVWNVVNGGGGWVHPMHMHMEEHTVTQRVGSTSVHPDDTGKEDVVALDPNESVFLYRNFRTFLGNYVAHCHNLAHEDHNMMFGWSIVP